MKKLGIGAAFLASVIAVCVVGYQIYWRAKIERMTSEFYQMVVNGLADDLYREGQPEFEEIANEIYGTRDQYVEFAAKDDSGTVVMRVSIRFVPSDERGCDVRFVVAGEGAAGRVANTRELVRRAGWGVSVEEKPLDVESELGDSS